MENNYKITYQGKVFVGESLVEVVQKAKAYEKELLSNVPSKSLKSNNANGVYRYDSEYDSIEIRFPIKPAEKILEKLYSGGWKWHRAKKCWYSKRNAQNIIFADAICSGNRENPAQIRQEMILSLCSHRFWKTEYFSYTLEELLELPQKLERDRLESRISHDFLRYHGITVPQNCDEKQLNILGNISTEFEEEHSKIRADIEEKARQLFEIAYQYQLDLYERETVTREIEKAKAEREKRKHLQRTLRGGEVLCPVCYTILSSSETECPECKKMAGLQPILQKLSLKESSFWETLQLFGGNLQPVDVARRLNFSSILGRIQDDFCYQESSLDPKFKELARSQIKNIPEPDISFDMGRKEFVGALSILCCQDKEWEHLCRNYCLVNSKKPQGEFFSSAFLEPKEKGKEKFMGIIGINDAAFSEFFDCNEDDW